MNPLAPLKTLLACSAMFMSSVGAATCYPQFPSCSPTSCCSTLNECTWPAVVAANPDGENLEWLQPCADKIDKSCKITMEAHIASEAKEHQCVTENSITWGLPLEHTCVDGFVMTANSPIMVTLTDLSMAAECKSYTLGVGLATTNLSVAELCAFETPETFVLSSDKIEDGIFTASQDIPVSPGMVWRISADQSCSFMPANGTFQVTFPATMSINGVINEQGTQNGDEDAQSDDQPTSAPPLDNDSKGSHAWSLLSHNTIFIPGILSGLIGYSGSY